MESFNENLPSPVRQTLEAVCCLQYVLLFTFYVPFGAFVFVMVAFSPLFYIPLLYGLWYLYDRKTPYRAGRAIKSWRSQPIFRYIANYFPITLHKTVDLDPSKNYIFVHHPHGVLGFSTVFNFATEATGVSEMFPGLSIYTVTLDMNFYVPVLRDLIIAANMAPASVSSIIYKLTKIGSGKAMVLLVGGAAEAGLSDPKEPYRLKLKHRKGFVRTALKTGASLVPVFSFGETSLYEVFRPEPSSLIGKFQAFVHKQLTFLPIIFYSRYFLLPYRYPINTIVGSPINIPIINEPTQDDVEKYHALYVNALQSLFDENVQIYGDPTKTLEIV